MKRKDIIKILKSLANGKPSESYYFSLMKRTRQIEILRNNIIKYRKDNAVLNLLKKFSKRFLETVETFGWDERFEYILKFMEEISEKGFIKRNVIKNLRDISRLSAH